MKKSYYVFEGKETDNELIKNTEERTIKKFIKYLEKKGYKVTKKTLNDGFAKQEKTE